MIEVSEDTISEYRVIPVTRYRAVRFRQKANGKQGGSECMGEFDNEEVAESVAYALAGEEARSRNLSPGDPRVSYPIPRGALAGVKKGTPPRPTNPAKPSINREVA